MNIQVKAIKSKKSGGWPIRKHQVKENIMYVFVCLNDEDKPPDYFICTSKEALSKVDEYSTRGIITLSTLKKGDDFYNCWDKIEKGLR